MKRRIKIGGMLRCCIASVEEDETTPNEEGQVIKCKHCPDSARFRDGYWEWSGTPADE